MTTPLDNNTHKRFYFWEDVPNFGVRCMGSLTGYACVEDLMGSVEMKGHIERNKEQGIPCWITMSTVFKVIVEGTES